MRAHKVVASICEDGAEQQHECHVPAKEDVYHYFKLRHLLFVLALVLNELRFWSSVNY